MEKKTKYQKTDKNKGGSKVSKNGKVKNPVKKIAIETTSQNSYFFQDRDDENQNMLNEPAVLTYGEVRPMIEFLDYNQKEAAIFLEVDPATISRWKKTKNEIGKLRTKNMFNVDEIVAKGIRIFGSEKNFKSWLNTTNNALGDEKPVELLKSPYGVSRVEEAIEALSWGTYL